MEETFWKSQLLRIATEKICPPEDRGEIYSTRFEYNLEQLKEPLGQVIGWQKTEKNGDDDIAGIDYWVETSTGTVPFGVTSTKHEKRKRLALHPDIPQIHIRYQNRFLLRNDEYIQRSIHRAIRRYQQEHQAT